MFRNHPTFSTKRTASSLSSISSLLAGAAISLVCQIACADITLVSPSINGGQYLNGINFTVTATSDVARVDLSADSFFFASLSSANNWSTNYTFTNNGARSIAIKSYNTSGILISTKNVSLSVVDATFATPQANANYNNGTPVVINASSRVTSVILLADTYEIGRANTRDANSQFSITPAILNTIGNRTFKLDAYSSNGSKIDTRSETVAVVSNLSITSPANGATFESGVNFTLEVNAPVGTSRVDYYADTFFLSSINDAASNFKRDLNLSNTGSRVLKAQAFNAAGTKLAESLVTITIQAATGTGGGGIGGAAVETQVKNIATTSGCAAYYFSNIGLAPKGYLKGMALTYAKSYCEAVRNNNTVVTLLESALRSDGKDALTQYGLTSSNAITRLRALYTLGIGEALRESSGNATEGYDVSAATHTAVGAEAGLFQTSYDSTSYSGVTADGISYPGAQSWLNTLMTQYKANPATCNYNIFMEGLSNRNAPTIGTGVGADFQVFSKQCPAFATEYALAIFRLNRNHYGPIVRKEAEYVGSCNTMLQNVEAVVSCGQ